MIKFKDFISCLTDYADEYNFIQVYEVGDKIDADLLYEGDVYLMLDKLDAYKTWNFHSLNIDVNGDENINEGLPFLVLYIEKG
jgi:hypothetical protein